MLLSSSWPPQRRLLNSLCRPRPGILPLNLSISMHHRPCPCRRHVGWCRCGHAQVVVVSLPSSLSLHPCPCCPLVVIALLPSHYREGVEVAGGASNELLGSSMVREGMGVASGTSMVVSSLWCHPIRPPHRIVVVVASSSCHPRRVMVVEVS